mmetsp:Transcript_25871/g.74154  ORF Transcript_25871/g.74154 Transcript_25871/m.74154 type:complete len:509 (+) Transcript_25871:83-1609(+)
MKREKEQLAPMDPVKFRMKNLAEIMTQPFDGEHYTEYYGIQPPPNKPGVQAPQQRSMAMTALHTLKELPIHGVVQFVRTVLPVTAALGVLGSSAGICYFCKTHSTVNDGSVFELLHGSISYPTENTHWIWAALLNVPQSISWGLVCIYIQFTVMLSTMWDYKVILRGLWDGAIVFGLVVPIDIILRTANLFTLDMPDPLIRSANIVLHDVFAMIVAACKTLGNLHKVQSMVRNSYWGMILMSMYVVYGLILILYTFFLRFLMSWPDGVKFAFAVFINPLLMELMSVMARFTARSCRHNHPTTSWQPIAFVVCFKKLAGRYVMGAMESNVMVTIASLALGAFELLGRTTMPMRDKFVYRRLFGEHLARGKTPYTLMTNVRNRSLRAETESIEGVTDMVFIIMGVTYPLMYKLSLNGTSEPQVGGLIQKAVIQWAIELVIDCCICLYMAMVQNYHILAHQKNKCPYWSAILSVHVWANMYVLTTMMLPFILCTVPAQPAGTEWMFCSAAS